MNKKAADKIISVYWFTILFIVAAAIVYMAGIFYGHPYDIREIEVDLLTDKIADCISQSGYIVENWESITEENFLQFCELNFETEDVFNWDEEGQYYVELKVFDFEAIENSEPNLDVYYGNVNLKDFCELKGDNFPVCLNRNFYAVDKENNQYEINILSIVRKTEKNN